jgi:hypothetical protein
MTTKAYPGYGSKLQCSTDAVHYFSIAQLRKIIPSGSKQSTVDQTNLLTPDSFTRPLATLIDAGQIEIEGVLDPQNGSQLQLGTLHAALTLAWWQVLLLSDGVTVYSFQARVAEYVPFTVQHNKALGFTAKLSLVGAMTSPAGAA